MNPQGPLGPRSFELFFVPSLFFGVSWAKIFHSDAILPGLSRPRAARDARSLGGPYRLVFRPFFAVELLLRSVFSRLGDQKYRRDRPFLESGTSVSPLFFHSHPRPGPRPAHRFSVPILSYSYRYGLWLGLRFFFFFSLALRAEDDDLRGTFRVFAYPREPAWDSLPSCECGFFSFWTPYCVERRFRLALSW